MSKFYLLPGRPKFCIREEWIMGLLVFAVVAQIGIALIEYAGIMNSPAPIVALSPLQGEALARQVHPPESAKAQDPAAFSSAPARG